MTYNKANNSLTTDFNVTPYYDDYTIDSNYYRILFKPGFAVQARELTQLQTILQNQVERFGRHVFVNGSSVIGGKLDISDVITLNVVTQYARSEEHTSELPVTATSRMPSSA